MAAPEPDPDGRILVDAPAVRPDLPADPVAAWPELRRVGIRLPLRDYLAEMWRRREFAVTVPLGELRAQNQDTALGTLWHLLNPLFLVGVYYLIFGVILDVSDRAPEVQPYVAFLLVGVIVFDYTRTSMQSGARMIVKNRQLVQSINFPRAILPVSALVAETITYLYAIPVMWLLLLLIPDVGPSWGWLLVVPLVLLQATFNLGLAMATARLTFHFRDVQQVLPFFLRLWFYVSGVLFPITPSLVADDTLRFVLQLNPMWAFVEIGREAFINGVFAWRPWAIGAAWAIVLLLVGFTYFRRAESEYGRV